MKHVLSLGAGVQSSALALMFARGEITPRLDCAIFADTGGEPKSVYNWLDRLKKEVNFPIYTVQAGKGLTKELENMIHNETRGSGIPAYVVDGTKKPRMLRRCCTRTFKIRPIIERIRLLFGIMYQEKSPKDLCVTQYIGISTDEMERMKPSGLRWIKNEWPLIKLRMSRKDCEDYLKKSGFVVQRSACVYCPYRTDKEWENLKKNNPEDFEEAVRVDKLIREGFVSSNKLTFLHSSCKPLDEVVFNSSKSNWMNVCDCDCNL